MEISEIKIILKERKITYEDLAKMTGLSKSTITKIFGGFAKYPRVDTMQAIEKALGISPETAEPSDGDLTDDELKLLTAYRALIPPMQAFMIEMIESIVAQPQNRAKKNIS